MGPTRFAIFKILNVLTNELGRRGLKVNKEKTVAMEFKKGKADNKKTSIWIGESEIKWVSEVRYLGVYLQCDQKWEKHTRMVGSKINKLGNMILQQVGKFVEQKDRVYLLDCCAFDAFGMEFCRQVGKKFFNDVGKSYHWLIKRSLGYNKFVGNHMVCSESGLLTWELKCAWKEFILWEKICDSDNEIMKVLFGDKKWETDVGKNVRETLMQYGKEVKNVKQLKENMMMFVDAMAVLKELEKE